MELLFEKSQAGRRLSLLPPCDVQGYQLPDPWQRQEELDLPQLSEIDLSRHYSALARRVHGVNDGFYPLGSCTMKYNPRINEDMAALPGFTQIHPLQPAATAQGCLALLKLTEDYLNEITGMQAFTFQPAAGAHGEFTGLLLLKAYHSAQGQGARRTKIIVPDSAHGTNPASANMCGFGVVNVSSDDQGCVDLEALRAAVGPDTAGLMLTNPNTVGVFDKKISEITRIVHEAGGLCYYDGANANAIIGQVRPGDMGFDVIHLNLHKTFSTPHGGGGPGSGPCGCKDFLAPFLPGWRAVPGEQGLELVRPAQSVGDVKAFYGNFAVVVRALTYLLTLGAEGVAEASANAVLNANYLLSRLKDVYVQAYPGLCMHEFVLSLEQLKHERGVSALDVAKALLDQGMHPPTMYFPLIVHEALMVEPTETESKAQLDAAAEVFLSLHQQALDDPESLRQAPLHTVISRPDETQAARNPKLRY